MSFIPWVPYNSLLSYLLRFSWLPLIMIWAYFAIRVYLAERNCFDNTRRLLKRQDTHLHQQTDQSRPNSMACLVGFRELPDLFKKCLSSYIDAGCRCLVVGIDGNDDQDKQMLQIFQEVMSIINSGLGLCN